MRRSIALALLTGWLLGLGTGALGVFVTGGVYEYQLAPGPLAQYEQAARQGWQPAPESQEWLRRPRFRFP